MKRTYKVAHSRNGTTKKIIKYFVTDAHDADDLDNRPVVAEFPIGDRYDDDEQDRHAHMFADYMNKVLEAKEQAYEQNVLLDILKK